MCCPHNLGRFRNPGGLFVSLKNTDYFLLSATATATATVAPTMGLLPMPRKPIISTENPPCGGFSVGA